MADTNAFAAIQPGWAVYGDDDEKIGTVHVAGDDYLEVEKGVFFIKDLFIPRAAVAGVDPEDRRVTLGVSRDAVGDMGWTEPPALMTTSNREAATTWGQGTIDDPAARTGRAGELAAAAADRFDGGRIEEPADDVAASRVTTEGVDPESVTLWSEPAGDEPPTER